MTETATPPARPADLISLQEGLAGRYTVEREVGRGGMGVVYLARDLALERLVAIKVLPPQFATQRDLRDRFIRETRTAAGLSHPNIVPIHAVEEGQGLVYYVMGYVDGETLAQRVRRVGPMPVADVVRVLQEVAWALSYAHGRGIIHRDVKPDNILVERATGRAFVLDFGIARVQTAATMTSLGESLGTPQYMSPEQAAGERVDARSDLYSLGIVAFYALTGKLPFDAQGVQAILAMHITKPAPPVASARPGLPPRLAEAVDRLLAKDPAQRFSTGEEFVTAIQGAQGAAAVQIAPQVRNFQRIGEQSAVQLLTVTLLLLALTSEIWRRPEMIPVLWLIYVVIFLAQLRMRARSLIEEGFGYDDVRAAFESDAKLRREEAEVELARRARAPQGRGWLWCVLGGVASVAVALVLKRMLPQTPVLLKARHVLAGFGGGLLGLGLMLRVMGTRRAVSRVAQFGSRVWLGRSGRVFFAWATRGSRASAADRGAGAARAAAAATTTQRVAALLESLPPDARKRLRDVHDVVARLDAAARALERRERELEEVEQEAAAGAGGGGGTLDDRRARIAADLRAARTAAAAGRVRALEAIEEIRLSLLRVRSGLGTADEMAQELGAARELARSLGELPGGGAAA
ncbi:MAG TPA: serine/threonine-protein kinase [Gemmatimonadaceae bacterium]|nr:serine/threonine-protein kinase [Gemmatimonadaceae bacterium]